jgi:phosphoglycerol transferase MdoB-like AlkP superfamily enzyme
MEYRNYKEENFVTHISKNMFMGESRLVQRYGTLVNNAVSIYNNKNTEEYINSLKYGRERTNEKEAAQKANIFIIQVESMDASIVKQKHNGSYVMPYLNSLTTGSVYYPYMFSYHLGGGTSDAEFSVINSVEPLTAYPSIKLTTYKAPNSFISKLAQANYETNAFHGNIGRFYNRDVAFHKFGFKEFYDIAKMNMSDVGWGAPDDQVFNFSLEKSREASKPFLSYVITMTSHGPFTNAYNYYYNDAYDDIEDSLLKDYFNSMSYVDNSIKGYVQSIKKEYDNAYIFIFGDHTPKIESDVFKQSSVMIDEKLYEFVPLFIITPDNKIYSEQKNAATFLDIAPTVLNASGIKFSLKSDGANLLNPDESAGKIPYRGLQWDRAELYNKIAAAMKD